MIKILVSILAGYCLHDAAKATAIGPVLEPIELPANLFASRGEIDAQAY